MRAAPIEPIEPELMKLYKGTVIPGFRCSHCGNRHLWLLGRCCMPQLIVLIEAKDAEIASLRTQLGAQPPTDAAPDESINRSKTP